MNGISRRDFMKKAGLAIAGASLAGLSGFAAGCGGAKAADGKTAAAAKAAASGPESAEKAKVYFTDKIDAEHLIKLYQKVNAEIQGKVAVKLHTGEPHGPNILPRDMVRDFMAQIPGATIIEANVAYGSPRASTEGHRETLETNGWAFCPVDIIDADGDVNLPVKNGFHLKEVAMGAHLVNYDSLVVLTHFNEYVKLQHGFMSQKSHAKMDCFSFPSIFRQIVKINMGNNRVPEGAAVLP